MAVTMLLSLAGCENILDLLSKVKPSPDHFSFETNSVATETATPPVQTPTPTAKPSFLEINPSPKQFELQQNNQ